jgi:hypothetical protein
MRLAALLVAGALLLGGCQSSDDDPQPTATPPSTAPSTSPTPSDAEVAAADRDVKAAIKTDDTAALRAALREAGELAGRRAAAEKDQAATRVDAESRLNYRIAGWWADSYGNDKEFADLYVDGALKSYEDLSLKSSLLSDLARLADHVQDDWKDETGKELSFHDTYAVAYDDALPDDD